VALFAAFVAYERRARAPMLPLGLFRRRNFTVGNVETFAMYGGLGVVFFLLVLFLQGVAGFSALEAGSATIPVTLVMFVLSMRFGRLADQYGPRWFMGAGPLISAVGLLLMLRLDADVSYWTDLLPALLVFSLGLSMTVAPLTATVLADADEHNAGIASAVNNAIARVASLVAIAAIGALVAATYGTRLESELGELRDRAAVAAALAEARDRPFAAVPPEGMEAELAARVVEAEEDASVESFHFGVGIATGLVALGGVLGLIGLVNPRREVEAEGCAGGQFVGAPRETCHQSPCDWHRHGEGAAAQPA
jgi:predicted MFS family arabinose efflux permease